MNELADEFEKLANAAATQPWAAWHFAAWARNNAPAIVAALLYKAEGDAYADMAGEIITMLSGAGFGKPGTGNTVWCMTKQAIERIVALESQRDKLQAFKDWVHAYLDGQGVPHHPPGTHGAAGCRIGDRMDWWRGQLAEARAERDVLRAEVERLNLLPSFKLSVRRFDKEDEI